MSVTLPKGGQDLVSVVIPTYNAEKTLDECLASVERQTHRELGVVLCVNDGSTDGSLAIARKHAAADGRVIVIDKPNEGYGASCNRGISEAHGTWVAIVEPDDVLEPTCYEDLLACAEQCGGTRGVDVARAAYWRAMPDGKGGEARVSCPYRGRVRPARQPFAAGEGAELLRHHPAIWAGFYRRDYLVEQGIRFVEVPGAGWADNPFLAETLLRTERIAYTDRCVYVYRERDLGEAESFASRSPLTPLERWNDMMDVAERAGVSDRRVLSALALRGVNYALITTSGAGADAPGVAELRRTLDGAPRPLRRVLRAGDKLGGAAPLRRGAPAASRSRAADDSRTAPTLRGRRSLPRAHERPLLCPEHGPPDRRGGIGASDLS